MKKYLVPFPMLLALAGCGQQELPYNALEEHKGLYYDRQTGELFTGIATESSNIAYAALLAVKAHNFKISRDLKCTSALEQGKFSGETVCHNQDGDVAVLFNFNEGKLDGDVEVYHQSTGNLYFKAEYQQNLLKGEKKIYNPEGNLVYEAEFEEGIAQSETAWTQDGSLIVRHFDEDEGYQWKWEDLRSGSSAYNRVFCKTSYNGIEQRQKHGKKECFFNEHEQRSLPNAVDQLDESLLILSGQYDHGDELGKWVTKDSNGRLVEELVYKRDKFNYRYIDSKSTYQWDGEKKVAESHYINNDAKETSQHIQHELVKDGSQISSCKGVVSTKVQWKAGMPMEGMVTTCNRYGDGLALNMFNFDSSFKKESWGATNLVLDGEEKYWTTRGDLFLTLNWDSGKFVSYTTPKGVTRTTIEFSQIAADLGQRCYLQEYRGGGKSITNCPLIKGDIRLDGTKSMNEVSL